MSAKIKIIKVVVSSKRWKVLFGKICKGSEDVLFFYVWSRLAKKYKMLDVSMYKIVFLLMYYISFV